MNTLLDEDEVMLKESAATLLGAESPASLVRSAEASDLKYSPELWRRVADLGWCGLCLPEEYDGQGAPLAWLGLLLEEVGRHIAPIPLATSSAAALTIARFGIGSQREILRSVASGESILSWAVQESGGAWNIDAVSMPGRVDGDDVVLDGTKLFVDGADAATHFLVAIRRQPDDAIGIALVDARAAGIASKRLVNMAKGDQATVSFRNVRIPRSQVIGGWSRGRDALTFLMQLAAVFSASLMAGAARRVTEMSAEYSNIRFAFGQPIGSFQSLQHMVADMLITVDAVELLSREALWRIDSGLPAEIEVAQAKSFGSQHCITVCRSAQQLHGGMGFMIEFDLNLWYRRVVSWSLCAGTAYEHRRIIASHLLDRPGHMRLDDCHPEVGDEQGRLEGHNKTELEAVK